MSWTPEEFDSVFAEELDREIAQELAASPYPKGRWLAAGYRPHQDEDWWRRNGPGMVRAFAHWYESQPPDITVWTAPDGRLAVELDMTVTFGRVPVRMAPDLVLRAGTALIVVDLKSGASVPDNYRQLGLYACGLEKFYGIRPRYGTFFMVRGIGKDKDTYLLPPVSLDEPRYSVPYFTRELETFDRAVRGGIFLANPGKICGMCGVNEACAAFGGDKAALYDPSHPNYRGRKD